MSEDQQELQMLGSLFRGLRLKKGWTLEQTEEHGWHDWKYLQKIESGRNITMTTFFNLCKLYGVRPERLLKSLESVFKL
ncbi:MAG: helix-turn-helix domain-containing protein [Bacteriovoracaceae bacterium]